MRRTNENVKVVSERLGHANIQITLDTYSHVLPTMQKAVMTKMDGILDSVAARPEMIMEAKKSVG